MHDIDNEVPKNSSPVEIFCKDCGFLHHSSQEHYRNKRIVKEVFSFCDKCLPNTPVRPISEYFDKDGKKIYWYEKE